MAIGKETLRLDEKRTVAARRHDRFNGACSFVAQPAAWGDDGDAHGQCLFVLQAAAQ
jgi:hypothetical protein